MLIQPWLRTTTKDSTLTCACARSAFPTSAPDWKQQHLTYKTDLPKLPFPSLGFFFIPNSGDPLEIGDCWVFGLRPTGNKRYWNHTLKTGKSSMIAGFLITHYSWNWILIYGLIYSVYIKVAFKRTWKALLQF